MAVRWRKLERPKAWRPTVAGQEIVGHYLGKTVKNGDYGQYGVALIAVPTVDGAFSVPYTANGVGLIGALDGSMVAVGALIRIVFGGYKDIGQGRHMKLYDVYVGEGSLSVEEIARYGAYLKADEEASA